MTIRICIAVDTVEEALEVFSKLKDHKLRTIPQVMIDPQKSTDGARVFDPERVPGKPAEPAEITHPVEAEFKNVSPGWVACQKIGSETKAAVLAHIGKNSVQADPEHIAKKIKRTPEQTKALLQLLWERRVIEYDRKTNSIRAA